MHSRCTHARHSMLASIGQMTDAGSMRACYGYDQAFITSS
jgi:hypothetical protein